jgi:hypothetical protein
VLSLYHKHHVQHSQACTSYHGVTLTHRHPIFGPNLTARRVYYHSLFHLMPRFRTITTHLCSEPSPYVTSSSPNSRQAVLMFRFFTCRLKNSIFEHFATEALYERSIQKSKHKGLLICSPYTTSIMFNTAQPLLHTMESH